MASLREFATFTATLDFTMIGKVPAGLRIDVPFEGTCTSSHWDGERPIAGVDVVTIGEGGIQDLDIHGRIGAGKQVVAYRAIGRGGGDGPTEVFTFETADEDLSWLNSAIGVGVGSIDGNQLQMTISIVER
jgi:hypothetical protein